MTSVATPAGVPASVRAGLVFAVVATRPLTPGPDGHFTFSAADA